MTGWRALLTCVTGMAVLAVPATAGARTDAPARASARTHDFHVSYTRMAIEPMVISAQIRLFADDITRALIERTRAQGIALNSPQGEAAFQAYVAAQFVVKANGRVLAPVVVSSAADKDFWSYVVTWTSPAPITVVSMHNAALFELFDDQQNIVKVKTISNGKESTLFYAGGSRADQVIRP